MTDNLFPTYLVLKCQNKEEFSAMMKLNITLPFTQVKITNNLSELAKDTTFMQVVPSGDIANNTENVTETSVLSVDEPSQDMNEITSPEPKKNKISYDVFHYSTEEEKSFNRILMVENAKFYIQSDELIKHSDYFCSLFTSDFKEKEQEIISIKIFNAEKIKLFMEAVYKKDNFDITEENLDTIFELFVYFQATDFLKELFEEKKVFETIAPEKILKLVDVFGLFDLKNSLEEYLIEQINQYYSNKGPWSQDIQICEQPVSGSLRLDQNYSLENLKDVIESHLASEFTRNLPNSIDHRDYINLLQWYHLSKLTVVIETNLISTVSPRNEYEIERFLSEKFKVEMFNLKTVYGEYLLKKFNESEPTDASAFKKYLELWKKCEYQPLKEKICRSLEELYKEVGQPSKMTLNQYNELVFKYELEPIKNRQEDFLLAEFHKNKEGYPYLLDPLSKHELPKLKEAVEDYLVSKFDSMLKNDDSIFELNMFIKYCDMERLKDTVEVYFLADFHSNHSFQYVKYALECKMEKFETMFADFIKSSITVNPILLAGSEFIFFDEEEDHHMPLQQFILRRIFNIDEDYEC